MKIPLSFFLALIMSVNSLAYASTNDLVTPAPQSKHLSIIGLVFGAAALCTFSILWIHSLDDKGLDAFDRTTLPEGSSRGLFGTIYNKKGNVDFWNSLFDINPIHSFDFSSDFDD